MRPSPYEGLTLTQVARRIAAPALFVGALFWLLLRPATPPSAAGDPSRELTTFEGATLGTDFTVHIVGTALSEAETAAASEAIRGELDEVDQLMSTWKDNSELSRLNRAPVGVPFSLSVETVSVLQRAAVIYGASQGAFDVTVAPLVRAWGFGAGAEAQPPSAADLATLRLSVGQDKLELGADAATRLSEGLHIDLSAIAKGWAVDEVSLALSRLGHSNHMVEVGGEVRASGTNASGQPWRIAIEQPSMARRTVNHVVGLNNLSMATSGDYRNFREFDGKRISHTIDPRTGRPVEHTLASVSVVAPTCVDADGWATALMVLGPEAGLARAEAEGLAAYFLVRTEDNFESHATSAFEAL